MSSTPIADHALLSDRHSAALVTRDGSVDWLSFPRFDSPAVFARLLDDDAGHWSIRPCGHAQVSRAYLERSLVLQTTFATEGGVLTLTDALAVGPDNHGHDLGLDAPHCLLRRVECTAGEVELDLEYAPRPEYGLIQPLLSAVPGGLTARGGAEWLVLSCPVELAVRHGTARATLHLTAGESRCFALHRSTIGGEPARIWAQSDIVERLAETTRAWRSWSQLHQSYEGPWAELVHHSGRVLQALSYQPTGAVVAAATTSLPETEGGERNWDYRYTWVRDASLTMEALWVAACPDEAEDFFGFVTTAAASSVVHRRLPLQIMFGVGGERDLPERTLDHLAGWRGSSPVRVGNAAWSQQQVDVYGELMGAAHRLTDQLGELDGDTRGFLTAVADTAASCWEQPDQGIWEIRGAPRHFVYSKLMCWVALDRAIALADRLGAQERVPSWRRTRDEIHATVLREGWNERVGAFTQSFGSDALDASSLVLALVGFLPPTDPRILATVEAVEQRLTDERGLVYRYRAGAGADGNGADGDGNGADGDGLTGKEGTFLLCTFWLAQANALLGRVDRARATFEHAIAYANDLGLLAEQVASGSGELLGNFPQAFSHVGLVNAAYAISCAQDRLD